MAIRAEDVSKRIGRWGLIGRVLALLFEVRTRLVLAFLRTLILEVARATFVVIIAVVVVRGRTVLVARTSFLFGLRFRQTTLEDVDHSLLIGLVLLTLPIIVIDFEDGLFVTFQSGNVLARVTNFVLDPRRCYVTGLPSVYDARNTKTV